MINRLPEEWLEETILEAYRKYHIKNEEKVPSVIEEFFERIKLSLPKAKEVHPYFKGLSCITSEYADLVKALESEDKIEIKKQLVHLSLVCLRMYLEQYDLE